MPTLKFSEAMPTPKSMAISTKAFDDISKSFLVELLDAKFAKQDALIRELLTSKAAGSRAALETTKTREEREAADVAVGGREVVQVCDMDSPILPIEMEESVQDDAVKTPSKTTTRTVKLGLQVMKERWEPDPPWKSFVKGPLDGYMGIVVVINLAFMILETQSTGAVADASLGLSPNAEMSISETFFEIAEYIFFTMHLGSGFKYFLFSPLFGEIIQFDYFSDGLKPPTRYALDVLLRVAILRHEWYYDPRQGFMFLNVFDACVVAVNAFELLVLPLFLGICR